LKSSPLEPVYSSGLDDESLSIWERVDRLGRGKEQNKTMVAFLGELLDREEYHSNGKFDPKVQKIYERMDTCSTWLTFRHYTDHDKNRLFAANFCGRHLLCQACAIRRGAQKLQAYSTRIKFVLEESPRLTPWMITLTVKNGVDLLGRFNHLMNNFKRIQKQRSKRLQGARGYAPTEFEKIAGAVFSYEVPRSKDGETWHPHIHMLVLCESKPDVGFVNPLTGEGHGLRKEWFDLTGDSFMVDVRRNEDQPIIEMACEVMKYAVKFSNQEPEETWEAFQALNGRRLFGSFGNLRGVKVPKSMLDAPLDGPFIEYVYRYFGGGNYEPMRRTDFTELYDDASLSSNYTPKSKFNEDIDVGGHSFILRSDDELDIPSHWRDFKLEPDIKNVERLEI